MKRVPRAVVFDCDGLLVDSARCWDTTYDAALAPLGVALTPVQRARLTGASIGAAAIELSAIARVPLRPERLRHALARNAQDGLVQARNGAADLLSGIAGGVPLAIASNAPRPYLEIVIERLRWNGYFDVVVSGEEVPKPKPAPDVYLEACLQLGVRASDAVALEDSPIGAAAARRAGLLVVGVPSAPLLELEADIIVPSLSDPLVHSAISGR